MHLNITPYNQVIKVKRIVIPFAIIHIYEWPL